MNIGDVGKIAGAVVADLQNLATAKSGQFVVNRDNVLAATKVIQNQVDSLRDRTVDAAELLRVVPPGQDQVSGLVAEEWNRRLVYDEGSYVERVKAYIKGLDNLVVQLRESAIAYGFNEDEIEAALGKSGD
ncbi:MULTISPECIES: PE domain-containing protein [Actinokineospora]|uniref:PE domain-containing protein n=1 Tax=Actinokineospora fastidiosa TaxID=1816 RepID=A0A918G6N8_9PSEU|nr:MULTISPECIES: PE domain-containing protein [Actinokineospora]UVS82595.1 hypothetical protein Actkin_06369 [Actinokineospora sp. UTMC 2448]GGS19950.1 hypothetical protein GCM10010171_10710 [Actinokineospora fastidiosa]